MKKQEVPQDDANMLEGKFTEPCYAVDEEGKYIKVGSVGWDAKNVVMQHAWDAVHEKVAEIRARVEANELSPIAYYMEKQLMDLSVIAGYTGFFRWTVKRHLKMDNFIKLNDKKLKKYADTFEISIETLKTKELL